MKALRSSAACVTSTSPRNTPPCSNDITSAREAAPERFRRRFETRRCEHRGDGPTAARHPFTEPPIEDDIEAPTSPLRAVSELAAGRFTGKKVMEISKRYDTNFPAAH